MQWQPIEHLITQWRSEATIELDDAKMHPRGTPEYDMAIVAMKHSMRHAAELEAALAVALCPGSQPNEQ